METMPSRKHKEALNRKCEKFNSTCQTKTRLLKKKKEYAESHESLETQHSQRLNSFFFFRFL